MGQRALARPALELALLLLCPLLAAAANPAVRFSHRRHVPARMACVDCHANSATAERAGFPDAARCMACHRTIAPLLALAKDARPFPTSRAVRLADFVFFSHARHQGVACAGCHGNVARADTVAPLTVKMKSCIDCHKARNATLVCNACHELNQ